MQQFGAKERGHFLDRAATPRPQSSRYYMTSFIELDALSVSLAGRPILRDLSGTFSGRSIGLLGPNGAGKTTLLQTLLGFHPPAAGTARVFGLDVRTHIRDIRHQIGYMP